MPSINMAGLEHIDRRIIYTSLLVVVVLAILDRLTLSGIYSLAVVLLIIFIVLGNVGFLYSRRRK